MTVATIILLSVMPVGAIGMMVALRLHSKSHKLARATRVPPTPVRHGTFPPTSTDVPMNVGDIVYEYENAKSTMSANVRTKAYAG